MAGVWHDGVWTPAESAWVPFLDNGFLFGEGVFESLRTYNGTPFLLDEHLDRLFSGLGLLNAAAPRTRTEMKSDINNAMAHWSQMEARIKLITTARGFYVLLEPLTLRPAALYEHGARLITSKIVRNERNCISSIKSLSFLDCLLVRREAQAAQADEALMFNTQAFVAEGASSNLFIVSDGTLRTPSLDQGILPGITRAFVLKLAAEAGIPCREQRVTRKELLAADEAFITGSIAEIVPVASLDGNVLGKGREITGQLRMRYRQRTQTAVLP
ncbi:MAG: aminotransferase class IV [Fibrobacterota bacterium]